MDIMHGIAIDADADTLFRALTTTKGISGWYTPDTKAMAKVGGLVECTFRDYGTLKFRVDELEPKRHVVWTVVQGPPEWVGTKLTFDLTESGGKIDFEFRHTGLPEKYDAFSTFSYLWAQYVRSIKLLAETGAGEPFDSPASRAAGTTP